jgi:hypothetical protein
VIDSCAEGVDSAGALTGVQTFLANASLAGRTLTVDQTLRMAVWRSAEVAFLAAADNSRSFKFAD